MSKHLLKHTMLLMCMALSLTSSAQSLPVRRISADTKMQEGKTIQAFRECIGAGRANEGLRADWQQQLAMVQKEIGFKYIRFHGLLHDDMRVYVADKNGKVSYNWQYIDKLFDYLLSIRIKPFVEFGFMPADLASGTKTIFWWKANVSKPKSYPQWDSLITALVMHWQERYGAKEVATWYFEVWNEPDLRGFFDGSQADYFELYNHTARAVKAVSKNYRVGGPATSATKWIDDFLRYCDSARLPVDFVSTHDYGTVSVLDEFGTKKQQLKPGADTIAHNVQRVRRLIDASPFSKAELHFTEWNTSPSSRDPVHDTYQNATYVLNTLKKTGRAANSLSYWTFTDIFEEAGGGLTPFHGGFGLLNLQDIKKPTYYAYKFMAELGPMTLSSGDSSSYICTSGNNVQALVWNQHLDNLGNFFDQDFFPKEQPSKLRETVDLRIANISNGRYKLEVYEVGYGKGDAYSTYLRMGKPAQLTRQQEAELKKVSEAVTTTTEISISNGTFTRQLSLRTNDIVFIKLTKL